MNSVKGEAFERLLKIMDELRDQCPWDRKQTMLTLRNLTIEETYELCDAVLQDDLDAVKEELGDLMLHLVFYAKIAEERNAFDISDILNAVCEKLIERHPHIYGDTQVRDADDVKRNWEQIKMKQKDKHSVLDGVPHSLPAMIKAYRMQEKTKQVGFEWKNTSDVWDKVQEEMEEFQASVSTGTSQEDREKEFGDVLFSLINYGRYFGLDPETCLARVNEKFKNRFQFIEAHATRPLSEMTLEEMDLLWNRAKELTG